MRIHKAFEIYWRQEDGEESDQTEYYLRADLVGSSCLLPVPDGGAVAVSLLDGNDKFIEYDGEIYYRSGREFICINSSIVSKIDDDTIVQPVRFKRL